MEYEFTISSACHLRPAWVTLFIGFALVWPFVSMAALRIHGRSAAPLAATLVPIAASSAAMWLTLAYVLRGASLTGGGFALAAARAEALMLLLAGFVPAAMVALFALAWTHRPVADRATALLAAVVMATIIPGLFAIDSLVFCFAAAAVALACAVVLIVRAFRASAGATPLRYGVTAHVVAFAALAFVAFDRARALVRVAIGG